MRETYSLKRFFDCERLAYEMLVNEPNVKIYGFSLDINTACNLQNYKDPAHYGEWVNKRILDDISQDRNILNNFNVEAYFTALYNFYMGYKIK